MSMSFEDQYAKLNPKQKMAVDEVEGPVLVVAVPGSGKTQLLSLRVANILRLTDTHPSGILCLTFTEAAAANMRQRLRSIIGQDAYKVAIHTFHSFGVEVINAHPEYFFFGVGYTAIDDLNRLRLLENILQELPLDNCLRVFSADHGWVYLRELVGRIKDLKQAGLSPEEYQQIILRNRNFLESIVPIFSELFQISRINNLKESDFRRAVDTVLEILESVDCPDWYGYSDLSKLLSQEIRDLQSQMVDGFSYSAVKLWRDRWMKKNAEGVWTFKDLENVSKQLALALVYRKYQLELHKQGWYDFEDMLLEVVAALEKYPDLRYEYLEKYLYISVDEFQDTNGVQMRLVNLLSDAETSGGCPNILAVGDEDQAVFKFQGATVANIWRFYQEYKDVKVVSLDYNYRSVQQILDLADSVIVNCSQRLTDLPGVSKNLISKVD